MTEKEIVKVTQVRMSVECPYLLGKFTVVLEGSFPNRNLTCKENFSRSLLILIGMFGEAEMLVKRKLL